jgi:hypothetical protein
VPADYRTVEGVAVSTGVNVAEALSAFARDIATGSTEVPDFDSAVDLHRTLALLDDTARRTAVEV